MSSAVLPARLSDADFEVADPGNGAALPHTKYCQVQLSSAAAETRSLPDPRKPGLRLALAFVHDGGDIVVTAVSAFDELGNTILTFNTVGQIAVFESVRVSNSALAWRLLSPYVSRTYTPAEANSALTGILATAAELNRAADVSTRIVPVTTATLALTVADHDGKILELAKADGIALTLPSLAASLGAWFRIRIKTTLTAASSIKSVAGTDIMVGHALMGNNSDNTVVDFQALASDTFDTIDLFTTGNTTGGFEGQEIEIIGGTGRWYVSIRGDAAGSEATPFQNTVA